MREIEADGYITRECDLSPEKKTCANCRWYQYSLIVKGNVCALGHTVTPIDWRKKYGCCDSWEKK